ncbi:MAG: T9SS type A sorting domain-containing protein [Salibacteraceae bacterium]
MRISSFAYTCVFLLIGQWALAQVSVNQIVIANGGRFGDPLENVNITLYDPVLDIYETIDTIQTQSVQNIAIEDAMLYVSAQDSIVSYNLNTRQRVAANKFTTPGAESAISIAVSANYVLVGNWFGPFGGTITGHNLRVFDKNTLAFVDSVDIPEPVKDIVVIGDTAYIARNFTSSSFQDSAGYLTKVDLTTLQQAGDITFSNNGEGLGRLLVEGNTIYGVNEGSNSLTSYDVMTQASSTVSIPANVSTNPYGSQAYIDGNELYFRYGGNYGFGQVGMDSIGVWDLTTQQITSTVAMDSNILAFAVDTINDRQYLTQSDFVTFNTGAIFEGGSYLMPLQAGFSPEAIGIFYRQGNAQPYAFNDTVSTNIITKVFDVQANDFDVDGDDLTTSIISTALAFGNATVLNGDSIEFVAFVGTTATQNIDYSICDNGSPSLCDTATLVININNPIGVEEYSLEALQVFPNPAANFWVVGGLNAPNAQILIRDVSGRLLHHQSANLGLGNSVTLNVADWSAGVYLLELRSEGQAKTVRLVKN